MLRVSNNTSEGRTRGRVTSARTLWCCDGPGSSFLPPRRVTGRDSEPLTTCEETGPPASSAPQQPGMLASPHFQYEMAWLPELGRATHLSGPKRLLSVFIGDRVLCCLAAWSHPPTLQPLSPAVPPPQGRTNHSFFAKPAQERTGKTEVPGGSHTQNSSTTLSGSQGGAGSDTDRVSMARPGPLPAGESSW